MNALLLSLILASSHNVWNITTLSKNEINQTQTDTNHFFKAGSFECVSSAIKRENKSKIILFCLSSKRQTNIVQESSLCTKNKMGYLGIIIENINIFEAICNQPQSNR
jgi:hypothetical protein